MGFEHRPYVWLALFLKFPTPNRRFRRRILTLADGRFVLVYSIDQSLLPISEAEGERQLLPAEAFARWRSMNNGYRIEALIRSGETVLYMKFDGDNSGNAN